MQQATLQLGLQSRFRLNNDLEIPVLGLAVWQSPPGRGTRDAVKYALEVGYRLIDTAKIYGNEEDVGIGIRESGVPRDEVFVTTKLWNSDHGYGSTIKACEESLRRLGLSYLDLYLIHWPEGLREETWKGMIALFEARKVQGGGREQLHYRSPSGDIEELECTACSRPGRI